MRRMTKNTMKNELNTKNFSFAVKEISEEGKFSGYASGFNVVDYNDDVVLRGAFQKTIENKWPKLLWQHNSDEPVGIFTSIKEDETGLFVTGQLFLSIQRAKEAYELLKGGAISGLSIGYLPVKWEYEERNNDIVLLLKEIDLWEISLVTFPANPLANVNNIKSLEVKNEIETFKAAQKLLKSLKGDL